MSQVCFTPAVGNMTITGWKEVCFLKPVLATPEKEIILGELECLEEKDRRRPRGVLDDSFGSQAETQDQLSPCGLDLKCSRSS